MRCVLLHLLALSPDGERDNQVDNVRPIPPPGVILYASLSIPSPSVRTSMESSRSSSPSWFSTHPVSQIFAYYVVLALGVHDAARVLAGKAATKVALSVYGIDNTLAVSYALGYHILGWIPITAMGFWYLGRMGLHLRDVGDGRQETGNGKT